MRFAPKPKILLVEDDAAQALVYREYLRPLEIESEHARDGAGAMQMAAEFLPDLVLLDLHLPDMHGLKVLEQLNAVSKPPVVIVITAHGSTESVIQSTRAGAFDYLQKPFDAERLRVTVRNAVEKTQLSSLVQSYQGSLERDQFRGFLGRSIPMQAVYRIIESAAGSRAAVFITGESGSGKEVCANAIHEESKRSAEPFIALNCAAIPRDLMESEIFGHVKGSFTGATSDRDGAASLADGGTLFLDEIGEMDMALQSKLLRFVQTGTFQRVGEHNPIKVDVRFICATNRDPLNMIHQNTFREDLYYRLHVIPIHLPALRECGDDVLLIANKFLRDYNEEEAKQFRGFSAESEKILSAYQWPGNVRQLQNVIRNVVVLNDAELVTADMLPPLLFRREVGELSAPGNGGSRPEQTNSISAVNINPLWVSERKAIEQAITHCKGNIPRAAALLEVSPSTIYRKVKQWEKLEQADSEALDYQG